MVLNSRNIKWTTYSLMRLSWLQMLICIHLIYWYHGGPPWEVWEAPPTIFQEYCQCPGSPWCKAWGYRCIPEVCFLGTFRYIRYTVPALDIDLNCESRVTRGARGVPPSHDPATMNCTHFIWSLKLASLWNLVPWLQCRDCLMKSFYTNKINYKRKTVTILMGLARLKM